MLSAPYVLKSGVRQGGLTSPLLFNIYTNDPIEVISSTRLGYQADNGCVNNLIYAGEMVLLSASVSGIRELVAIIRFKTWLKI